MITMHRTSATPSVFSLMAGSFAGPETFIGGLFKARSRHLDRAQMLKSYNDLIETADEHILRDIGVTRENLFRMRAELCNR
jgi:hypothetical protein